MKVINIIQGTPEWHTFRREHYNASEAPVMMGVSPYMTRDALLALKKFGIEKEVSAYTEEVIYANGHKVEAAIRPHIEAMIGDDLFPVVGELEIDGLLLGASFDGLTMAEHIAFECKQWNAELAAAVSKGEVPETHYWQLEQQALVAGLDSILFVVTNGTPEQTVHCEYKSLPERRAKLIAGWKQFDEDLKTYEHRPVDPAPVGQAPETLPALHIEVTGMVTASNLESFKSHALGVFADINTDLQTDADFANAEKTVKWCGDVESRLEAAKQHALSQTQSIDALFRAIDEIKAEARTKRLELEKLVKFRKESIRVEIKNEVTLDYNSHINMLNDRLGKPYMPTLPVDFVGAMKGKKTVSSLRSAVNDELARAKIAANEIADRIQINLNTLREKGSDHAFLFADAAQIILKNTDDLTTLVNFRITEHITKEKEKAERLAEDERDRIRQEEAAKLAAKQETPAVATPEQDKPLPAAAAGLSDSGNVVTITRSAPETKPSRPSDLEIIQTLGAHFGAENLTVIGWLLDMDIVKADRKKV